MPDRRKHRGAHPADARLFGSVARPALQSAVHDFSWLLSRGYAEPSALKLVGDRYQLVDRQRTAVNRGSCSDLARDRRRRKQLHPEDARSRSVAIDGFNVLTTVEAALAGGVVLHCRDGCLRDMASMHGSYRKVTETQPAIDLTGEVLADLGLASATWLLDRPVSNSGRLATLLREAARRHGWNWTVAVVDDPDPLLAETEHVAATADSQILDACGAWLNLAREVVARRVPDVWLVELCSPSGRQECR